MDDNTIGTNVININNNFTMKTIQEHLESEQAKETPDKVRIEEIFNILSKKTITFNAWRLTGKFIYEENYQTDQKLLKSCVEVIEYVGGAVIQVLNTAEFKYKNTKSTDLEVVERALWSDVMEKLWCNNC